MRYFLFVIWLVASGAVLVVSCEKYESKKAANPNLTNHYCDDPTAVNYNWGFPGIPDSTICYYPTDVFSGKWEYLDSVSIMSSGLFIGADSIVLTITKISKTQMTVTGFCGSGGSLLFTATPLFVASIDTLISDTLTYGQGQAFCIPQDTINGTFTKDILYDSIIHVNLTVSADTGVVTLHSGTAHKLQ